MATVTEFNDSKYMMRDDVPAYEPRPSNAAIARVLRQCLIDREMSNAYLAKVIGESPERVEAYCNGQFGVNELPLDAICRALDVTTKQFIAWAQEVRDEILRSKAIDHPPHYGGDTTYEAIKVIDAWGLGFSLGNAVKYICRAGKKDATTEIEDLRKARWYIDYRIKQLEAAAS